MARKKSKPCGYNWACKLAGISSIGLSELITVIYIYGINKFKEDIKFMIRHKPGGVSSSGIGTILSMDLRCRLSVDGGH
ncbi:hypothetical protein ATANTOWER_030370 [Ataeniobius toweri]|uniref:Uncharacterized protein n=1 Tax=Ataeniobius toweri TaxID=208326 RepID=A0ABU7CAX3_9TELE|nr:hypothetical protein [Ataeniobius toweri]